jgi:hypothetical protein
MTITAQAVIKSATTILQDAGSVTWTAAELVEWLNAAQRAIVSVRPDATNTLATPTLALGTRQNLLNMGLSLQPCRLMDVLRNAAAASNKTPVTLVERRLLQAQVPGWHAMTPTLNIQHYTYDEADQTVFYVYPPAATGAQLDLMFAAFPADIAVPAAGSTFANVTGNLALADEFFAPLLDLVLYRAYSKNADYAGNGARAMAHAMAASRALGADVGAADKPKEA